MLSPPEQLSQPRRAPHDRDRQATPRGLGKHAWRHPVTQELTFKKLRAAGTPADSNARVAHDGNQRCRADKDRRGHVAQPRRIVALPPGACEHMVTEGLGVLFMSRLADRLAVLIFSSQASPVCVPSYPKQIVDAPPGAWCSLVVDLSVRTFPAFWFAPLANLFADVVLPKSFLASAIPKANGRSSSWSMMKTSG